MSEIWNWAKITLFGVKGGRTNERTHARTHNLALYIRIADGVIETLNECSSHSPWPSLIVIQHQKFDWFCLTGKLAPAFKVSTQKCVIVGCCTLPRTVLWCNSDWTSVNDDDVRQCDHCSAPGGVLSSVWSKTSADTDHHHVTGVSWPHSWHDTSD